MLEFPRGWKFLPSCNPTMSRRTDSSFFGPFLQLYQSCTGKHRPYLHWAWLWSLSAQLCFHKLVPGEREANTALVCVVFLGECLAAPLPCKRFGPASSWARCASAEPDHDSTGARHSSPWLKGEEPQLWHSLQGSQTARAPPLPALSPPLSSSACETGELGEQL